MSNKGNHLGFSDDYDGLVVELVDLGSQRGGVLDTTSKGQANAVPAPAPTPAPVEEPPMISSISTFSITGGTKLYHVSKEMPYFNVKRILLSPKISGVKNMLGLFSTSIFDALSQVANCANHPRKETLGWIHEFVVDKNITGIRMDDAYDFKAKTNPSNTKGLENIEKEICVAKHDFYVYGAYFNGVGYSGKDISGQARHEFALCLPKIRGNLRYTGTHECRLDGLKKYEFNDRSNGLPEASFKVMAKDSNLM